MMLSCEFLMPFSIILGGQETWETVWKQFNLRQMWHMMVWRRCKQDRKSNSISYCYTENI